MKINLLQEHIIIELRVSILIKLSIIQYYVRYNCERFTSRDIFFLAFTIKQDKGFYPISYNNLNYSPEDIFLCSKWLDRCQRAILRDYSHLWIHWRSRFGYTSWQLTSWYRWRCSSLQDSVRTSGIILIPVTSVQKSSKINFLSQTVFGSPLVHLCNKGAI